MAPKLRQKADDSAPSHRRRGQAPAAPHVHLAPIQPLSLCPLWSKADMTSSLNERPLFRSNVSKLPVRVRPDPAGRAVSRGFLALKSSG